MCRKPPRISDVDMFSTFMAERQPVSSDTADNCVHSSGEIKVVPPSPLRHSKSFSVQNTRVLMGRGSTVGRKLGKKRQHVGRYPDLEMLNDVEPDGSQLSSCDEEDNSGSPEVNSTAVNLAGHLSTDKYDKLTTDSKQKLVSSLGLIELRGDSHLPDSRDVSATSQSQSDDVAQDNTESCSVTSDNTEIISDLATQSSVADQSFYSCVTMDLDSSQVICSFAVTYRYIIYIFL